MRPRDRGPNIAVQQNNTNRNRLANGTNGEDDDIEILEVTRAARPLPSRPRLRYHHPSVGVPGFLNGLITRRPHIGARSFRTPPKPPPEDDVIVLDDDDDDDEDVDSSKTTHPSQPESSAVTPPAPSRTTSARTPLRPFASSPNVNRASKDSATPATRAQRLSPSKVRPAATCPSSSNSQNIRSGLPKRAERTVSPFYYAEEEPEILTPSRRPFPPHSRRSRSPSSTSSRGACGVASPPQPSNLPSTSRCKKIIEFTPQSYPKDSLPCTYTFIDRRVPPCGMKPDGTADPGRTRLFKRTIMVNEDYSEKFISEELIGYEDECELRLLPVEEPSATRKPQKRQQEQQQSSSEETTPSREPTTKTQEADDVTNPKEAKRAKTVNNDDNDLPLTANRTRTVNVNLEEEKLSVHRTFVFMALEVAELKCKLPKKQESANIDFTISADELSSGVTYALTASNDEKAELTVQCPPPIVPMAVERTSPPAIPYARDYDYPEFGEEEGTDESDYDDESDEGSEYESDVECIVRPESGDRPTPGRREDSGDESYSSDDFDSEEEPEREGVVTIVKYMREQDDDDGEWPSSGDSDEEEEESEEVSEEPMEGEDDEEGEYYSSDDFDSEEEMEFEEGEEECMEGEDHPESPSTKGLEQIRTVEEREGNDSEGEDDIIFDGVFPQVADDEAVIFDRVVVPEKRTATEDITYDKNADPEEVLKRYNSDGRYLIDNFKFSSDFDLNVLDIPSYSYRGHASKRWCYFELFGKCMDDKCPYIHEKEYMTSPVELVMSFMDPFPNHFGGTKEEMKNLARKILDECKDVKAAAAKVLNQVTPEERRRALSAPIKIPTGEPEIIHDSFEPIGFSAFPREVLTPRSIWTFPEDVFDRAEKLEKLRKRRRH
ncbi:hypothetical protein QR680_001151 [Steinernema hermaphroditum]|uniref:Uncharacterized protein n=1 Tax=Steinernema hermaphroditum TaxID=289476 RepID=A0AA39GX43_9BILA|nr:hypothetical protein QR680_001151 [Steinernema hermaphroditum]